MSVTIVGRWQVSDSIEEAKSARPGHALAVVVGAPPARRQAHVFRSLEDRRAMLYVGEWASRSAFEAYRDQAGADAVESAFRESDRVIVCERLMFFGNYAYRSHVTGCLVVEAPPSSADEVYELLLPNGRWAMHGAAGLVRYTIYREVTHARRYVIVHGWQSAADLDALHGRWAVLADTLARLGVTMLQFAGREQFSIDPL